ncbi:MAG: DUF1640 domain-containing protein [Nitrospirae bacterium]|nr:DUF1640 domain-containing protein [Magnetococcales bacterium]HAT51297.1 DUF1640 domain-containing protein [Alphaproteobacteria bacterium]
MTTITFDTYTAIKRLKAAGFDELQAEALSDTIKEAQETQLADLATKGDIRQLELKLEAKIAESKAETIKWMFGVATGQAMFIIAILKLFPSH